LHSVDFDQKGTRAMLQSIQNSVTKRPSELSMFQGANENSIRTHGHRKLQAEEILWQQGEKRNYICCVVSGALCFSRMLPDGRRTVLGFAYPGDIIGLGSDVATSAAHALQSTRLEMIPAASFKRAATDNAELGQKAAAAIALQLDEAYQHVAVVSKMNACERLASFLVALSARNARRDLSPMSVVLPMKRLDIADFLGLTIETVSRTFTQFRSRGWIELQGSNVVMFKRLDCLKELAAGNRCDQ
jgi:CRP/FNR family transcriptional regulator, anaerobic regulatory protein